MGMLKEIVPKMLRYRLARAGIILPGRPINLTFSITNVCQSRCKTCNIWELYKKHPEKKQTELTIDEIAKIFKSIGHVYIFNISGGEPFLRPDIADIIKLACQYLTPGIIHIPTNAISTGLIEKRVVKILTIIQACDPSIRLTIKPSLDHIGEKHDIIRGVPGNFEKVISLFNRLKELQADYPFMHAELGTVISRWNVKDIDEIAGYISHLGADSYRNEIAEERSEMFNLNGAITPDPQAYENAIESFTRQIRTSMKHKSVFQRITNGFRLVYYDLAVQILKEQTQVIPCYAGISNVHLTPYGDVWPCCTLGYEGSVGNLRDFNYDFQSVWNSRQAKQQRSDIRAKRCHCPLANQTYSNMLLHWPSLFRVIRAILFSK
jgi:MoaA/NifB/PqqE/SkfB family radical SAM enzyme